MKHYSYSYKYKARFYGTLNIGIEDRKLLRTYHRAKDQAIKGETVYFIKKNKGDK
jgi:hypothetical protein